MSVGRKDLVNRAPERRRIYRGDARAIHYLGAGECLMSVTSEVLARCVVQMRPVSFQSLHDWKSIVDRTPPEFLKGTVDILILRALAWQRMHGYAIARWIDRGSDGVLVVEGAALYQALHRVEHRKLVAASWGLSENNRKAKFYSLTASGKARLRAESAVWTTYANAVSRILSPA